ncbi:MAG: energy transducer TonB [Kiritimatiellia bacterium]
MDRRAIRFSVIVNLILFVVLSSVSFSGCLFEKKEEIVPMEFLVVTEENAADQLAEEPNEVVEPEPEPTPPVPDPVPDPDPIPPPAVPDPDPIPPPPPAVKDPDPIPPPKPPKQEKPKVELPKEPPKKPVPPKWKPNHTIKTGKRSGPVTTGKRDPKKVATQKALSAAEIAKLLAAGARPGNRNQIPANEASRCYGVIAAAFRKACNEYGLETSPTGKSPILSVTFGKRGSIRSISVKVSSGDRAYDNQILAAVRQVRRIDGLSDSFLAQYATVNIAVDVN